MFLKKLIHRLVVFCLIIAACLGGYFYMKSIAPKNIEVTSYKYQSKDLPQSFDGFKIGFMSDLEIADKEDMKIFEKAIKALNEADCDLVILGGDLFKSHASYDEQAFISLLKSIKAPYGKFSILGENEANGNIDFVVNLIKKGGFEVMRNQAHPIYYNDTSIILAGMENSGDVDSVLSEKDKKQFILAVIHQPDYFTEVQKSHANLQLSGHSHGGYIQIPFYGGIISQEGAKTYIASHYQEKNKDLYISNGVGMEDGQTLRFNTKPGPMTITLKYQKENIHEKKN